MASSLINTECKRYGCIKNLLACYANCRYSTRCEELKNEISDKTEQAAKDINSYLSQRGAPPITIQLMKRGLKFDAGPTQKPRPSGIKETRVISKASLITSPPFLTSVEPSAVKATPRNSKHEKKRVKTRPRMKRKLLSSDSALKKQASDAREAAPTVRVSRSRPASMFKEVPKPVVAKSLRSRVKKQSKAKQVANQRPPNNSRAQAREKIRVKKRIIMKKISKRAASPAETVQDQGVSGSPQVTEAVSTELKKMKSASARKRKNKAAPPASRGANGKVFIVVDGKSASLVDEKGLIQHLLSNQSSTARYFEATEVEARVQIVHKK